MRKIVMMAVLSSVIALGGQHTKQINVQKVTKIIDNRDGAFTINFDVDSLQTMIMKTADKALKEIKIDIAPGKTVMAINKSVGINRKDGIYSWFGKTLDGKGQVVLSVYRGRMMGTVTMGTDRYTITPDGDHFKVTKNDPSMMVPVGEDEVTSPFKLEVLPPLNDTDTYTESATESTTNEEDSGKTSASGSTTVDVMVLYTKAMKQKYGTDTELKIQHLFDLTKTAYQDSQTKVNMHLVHMQQLPTSSTLNNVQPDSSHLNALASDGYVAYLRRKYHADMVSVMSRFTGGGVCGIGFLPKHTNDPMTRAFSIVMVRSASEGSGSYCSDMTFAHELGHNFSCQHDRDHTSGSSMFEYAYGYDIANEFATIMSYDRPKISYFSNPNLTDTNSGDPIGVADEEDNARAIRNTRTKIADNSDEIDESLESGDHSLSDGKLNTNKDRDAYFVTLGGHTSFRVAHPKYSNTWGYYINIYNTETHTYVQSCKNDCSMDLDNGNYRVVVSYHNEQGSYYNGSGDHYAVEVSTEYSKPSFTPVTIINYLLQ